MRRRLQGYTHAPWFMYRLAYSRPLRCLHERVRQLAVLDLSGYHPSHKILSSPRQSEPPIDVSCPFLSAYLPLTKIKNEKLNIIMDELNDDDGRTDGRMDEGKNHGIVPCQITDRMISISQRRKKQFKCVWETFGKLPRYSTKRLISRLHRTFGF